MPENIKVHEKDKHIFDMLQAELTLMSGKKINQQELFSSIIKFTRSKKKNFFAMVLKLPLSEKEIKKEVVKEFFNAHTQKSIEESVKDSVR